MNTNATILIVEDDRPLAEALGDTLELAGYNVAMANDGYSALKVLETRTPALVVSDVHMPGMDGHTLLRRIKDRYPQLPVLLMTAYASIGKAVEAMQHGAADYLVKPFEAKALLALVERYLPNAVPVSGPLAEDPRSQELLTLARRLAASEVTVMLTGDSGTGKEVMARYIHQNSQRADGPFVAINCAAIPDNMLEATLFGYEKGAFTGAHKATAGKFEQADGGTLLLDEISEMELGLQAKLLRVLQEKEVERLGGGKPQSLDVRVIATSNRDMRGAVQRGEFREDLYYRLNVFPLNLPSLRERPLDILPLARLFLARAAHSSGRVVPVLTAAACSQLEGHSWPGNVRELDNMMQRCLILQTGDRIDATDLHFEGQMSGFGRDNPGTLAGTAIGEQPAASAARDGGDSYGDLNEGLKAREHRLIIEALRAGSRKQAAERLGISQRTLRYKLARMREQGISIPERLGT